MATLRSVMDAAFWDLELSSSQTLQGSVRSVPGEPAPVGLARSSKVVRGQQMPVVAAGFPLGLVPSLSPAPIKEHGSLALASPLLCLATNNWWTVLVGQVRPKKLVTNLKNGIKEELSKIHVDLEEFELPSLQDAKKFVKRAAKGFDPSVFALGLLSQFAITPETNLLVNVEGYNDSKKRRSKATLVHALDDHDITIEATVPGTYLDRKGTYWEVPTSLSLNLQSLISPTTGFRYRVGLLKNTGKPEPVNPSDDTDVAPPVSLMPGVCAKAACSWEKKRDLWREKEKKRRYQAKYPYIDKGPDGAPVALSPPYDERLKEPHAAVSGILGGTCEAWFGGDKDIKRSPFHLDLFCSICYTIQRGRFTKDFNDLTRLDARLDINSASAFLKGTGYLISDIVRGKVDRKIDPFASPKLNLIFQQQVSGGVVFRVDSRIAPSTPTGRHLPYIEDVMYSLTLSLIPFETGKIVAWYSPKRREAMVEFKLLEF